MAAKAIQVLWSLIRSRRRRFVFVSPCHIYIHIYICIWTLIMILTSHIWQTQIICLKLITQLQINCHLYRSALIYAITHCWIVQRPGLQRQIMMTSSNGNIFRATGHMCGDFTGYRWILRKMPVTRNVDIFFDQRLNRRLIKQSWGWWFETPSRPLWRHCSDTWKIYFS